MRSRLLLSLAGLSLGLVLSFIPQVAPATTSFFPFSQCDALCLDLYNECVAERGLRAGCGRELQNCYRFCRTGTL